MNTEAGPCCRLINTALAQGTGPACTRHPPPPPLPHSSRPRSPLVQNRRLPAGSSGPVAGSWRLAVTKLPCFVGPNVSLCCHLRSLLVLIDRIDPSLSFLVLLLFAAVTRVCFWGVGIYSNRCRCEDREAERVGKLKAHVCQIWQILHFPLWIRDVCVRQTPRLVPWPLLNTAVQYSGCRSSLGGQNTRDQS